VGVVAQVAVLLPDRVHQLLEHLGVVGVEVAPRGECVRVCLDRTAAVVR
jgi:hypothetical protein